MATATVQEVSTEALKEAIMLLIEEHKTEFKQLLNGSSSKKKAATKKKQDAHAPVVGVQKERVPYYEMPFWKANPHLKPLDARDLDAKPLGKDFFQALKNVQESFKDLDISDEEWLEQIKD